MVCLLGHKWVRQSVDEDDPCRFVYVCARNHEHKKEETEHLEPAGWTPSAEPCVLEWKCPRCKRVLDRKTAHRFAGPFLPTLARCRWERACLNDCGKGVDVEWRHDWADDWRYWNPAHLEDHVPSFLLPVVHFLHDMGARTGKECIRYRRCKHFESCAGVDLPQLTEHVWSEWQRDDSPASCRRFRSCSNCEYREWRDPMRNEHDFADNTATAKCVRCAFALPASTTSALT